MINHISSHKLVEIQTGNQNENHSFRTFFCKTFSGAFQRDATISSFLGRIPLTHICRILKKLAQKHNLHRNRTRTGAKGDNYPNPCRGAERTVRNRGMELLLPLLAAAASCIPESMVNHWRATRTHAAPRSVCASPGRPLSPLLHTHTHTHARTHTDGKKKLPPACMRGSLCVSPARQQKSAASTPRWRRQQKKKTGARESERIRKKGRRMWDMPAWFSELRKNVQKPH